MIFFYFKEDPQSEILWASEHGNFELVNELLERDPLLVNTTDKDGYTPLHRACYNNNVQIVEVSIFIIIKFLCLNKFFFFLFFFLLYF